MQLNFSATNCTATLADNLPSSYHSDAFQEWWGSGMNYRKKGLKRLLDGIVEDEVGRLVLTHKDRLLRFGAELIFALCQTRQVEVVIINQGEDTNFEEELASDVLEIITVVSARLYGSRNQKLIDGVRAAVKESQCT
ncbi:recombinase family protein [Massilia sp. CFBP9026]